MPSSGIIAGKQSDSINAIDSTLSIGQQGLRPSSANISADVTLTSTRTNNSSDSSMWPNHQSAIVGHHPASGATRLLTSPQEAGLMISPIASTSTTLSSLMPTYVTSSPSLAPAPSSTLSSALTPAMPALTVASFSSLSSPVNTLKAGEHSSLILAQTNEGTSIPAIFSRQQPSSSGINSSSNIQPSSPSPAGSINSSTSIASSSQNTNHLLTPASSHHGRATSPVHNQV